MFHALSMSVYTFQFFLHRQEVYLSPESEQKKICVVDDEFEMRVFLTNLLNTGGYETVVFKGGGESLRRVIAEKPALIILNISRYRDSNTLLYRDLKQDKRLKQIPVIMLSTLNRETFFHYQKFKKAPGSHGFPAPEAYINKPPEADELLDLVRSLTASAQPLAAPEIV
jgi:CheY-like chemotaxis protein